MPTPLELEPDVLMDEGRKRLLDVTRGTVGLQNVETSCGVYGDDATQMTNARLLARFLSRFRIYNPLAGEDHDSYTESGKQLPSLDAAWAYWEHVTLARHYTDGNDNDSSGYVRADVGERDRPTNLYPVWRTPVKDLMAWGVSVRMYFSTLLTLSAFLAAAGILNLPLVWYFRNYDGDADNVSSAIKGSAVCENTAWVACEDCNLEYADLYPSYRLDGDNVMVNTCNFDDWMLPGLLSYVASITLMITFGISYFWLQRKAEVVFDEEIQTASDYSIKVSNPPRDALDPEEWRRFFKPFASENVTMVTIAVDNAELIDTLVKRRKIVRQLKNKIGVDVTKMEEEAAFNLIKEKVQHSMFCFPCSNTAENLYEKVRKYDEEVKALLQKEYGAVTVFVSFETERAQRTCLHALSTGKINLWRNQVDTSSFEGNKLKVKEAAASSSLDIAELVNVFKGDEMEEMSINVVASSETAMVEDLLRFRHQKVLAVKEAGEPNDVRWKDLQVSGSIRMAQFLGTTVIMIVFVTWSGFFIADLQNEYPGTPYTALYITATNIVIPKICELVNGLESHSTEANRNVSLYIKVALFRWFNSAICMSIITGFIQTISVDRNNEDEPNLPKSVYMIIYAEMLTIPIIKLVDPMGNVRKHILAPRAEDQEEMNSYFGGGKFELAERYSDATKVLFVALFYSAILPESLLLGSVALLAHFWSGKFCLMRLWRSTPDIGTHLASASRNIFFSTSLIAHVLMSAYFWSGYPFDNVCEVDGQYQYCDQDMFRSAIFPPLPRFQPEGSKWMTESQETIVSLYGYTSVVVVGLAIYVLITQTIVPWVQSFFRSTYEPDGEDQGIDLSSVKHRQEVHGYIPQFREKGFAHPLLACDVSGVDEHFIGWKDHVGGFEAHNLFEDVRNILGGQHPPNGTFSIVKHWPPSSSK